jgi:hypothetical protein
MRAIEVQRLETYPLLVWDPAGDDTVTIREARAGETALRDGMLATRYIERELPDGTTEREYQRVTWSEIAFAECWATFAGANIIYNGVPLFVGDISHEHFAQAWSVLPDELIEEWHGKVREHNPDWSVA